MDRDEAIRRIRTALRRRTGLAWSVSGGRGTAYGWIKITAPPRRLVDEKGQVGGRDAYYMSEADRRTLAQALGLRSPVHFQGERIPASREYRQEYVDRAEGRNPSVFGTPYWD